MAGNAIELDAYWGVRQESAEACARRLAVMLEGLAAANPAFGRWNRGAHSREAATAPWCSMPPRIAELTRIFERGRNYKDFPREPIPDLGFRVAAWNGQDDPRGASFSIQAGSWWDGKLAPNSVMISLPVREPGNEDMLTAACLKTALRSVMAAWEPAWANVFSSSYTDRLYGPDKQYPRFRSGWMTYLSPWYARQITPPRQAITETMADGGLLMLATEQPFSVDNPAHVAAADAIQAALAPIQDSGPLRP